MKKRIILNILSTFFALAILLALLSFANMNQNEIEVNKLIVTIENANEFGFIDNADIKNAIVESNKNIYHEKLSNINFRYLEDVINEIPCIENSEVYSDFEGNIYVKALQRRPIARIINYANEGYYIDEWGKLMPLSEKYSARVPVFTGDFFESYAGNHYRNLKNESSKAKNDTLEKLNVLLNIYKLASYIDSSEFWKAQIEQVNIKNNDYVIIPKAGMHEIVFGNVDNIDEKFSKLFFFYKNGLSKVGWNKYNRIYLDFKNQVIAETQNDIKLN